jgi:hypothetical protein
MEVAERAKAATLRIANSSLETRNKTILTIPNEIDTERDSFLDSDHLHHKHSLLTLLALLVIFLPSASGAPPCLIQNVSLNYPSAVMPREQINMLTHVQANCLQWPPMSTAYVIRVDLTDTNTHYVLSTSTYLVGYNQSDIDAVLVNPATAPGYSGVWVLEVDFYIFQGGQMLVHGSNMATLQVGNTISTTYPTTTSMTSTSIQSTNISQPITTIQNSTMRTEYGPSIDQLEETLIVLFVVLATITLTFFIKVKKRKTA